MTAAQTAQASNAARPRAPRPALDTGERPAAERDVSQAISTVLSFAGRYVGCLVVRVRGTDRRGGLLDDYSRDRNARDRAPPARHLRPRQSVHAAAE
jgi:hypothetical protein